MRSTPAPRKVESALRSWAEVFREGIRLCLDDEELDELLTPHAAIVNSYCSLCDWETTLRDEDFADPVLKAIEMLEYYANFSIQHDLLARTNRLLDRFRCDDPLEADDDYGHDFSHLLYGLGDPHFTTSYPWATPRNCLTFFPTGGDGVHYTFLAIDGHIHDRSPIVEVDPTWFPPPVVAADLREFLELGLTAGGFMAISGCHDDTFEPASAEFDPHLDWFAKELKLHRRVSSPKRLRELNLEYGFEILDPWRAAP